MSREASLQLPKRVLQHPGVLDPAPGRARSESPCSPRRPARWQGSALRRSLPSGREKGESCERPGTEGTTQPEPPTPRGARGCLGVSRKGAGEHVEPGWLSNSTIWSSIPAPKSPCFSPTPLVLSSLPAHLLLLLFLLLLGHLGSLVLPHQLRQVGHVLVRLLQQVGQPLVLLLVDQLAVPFLILSLGGEEEFSTPTP